jgi:hypothetical protein
LLSHLMLSLSFFPVLGFELRASHLIDRSYTFWAILPALFAFSHIFGSRVLYFFWGSGLRVWSSYVCFLSRWDCRHILPHLVYLLKWGLADIFQASVILLISACRIAGITGLSYHTWSSWHSWQWWQSTNQWK